MNSDTLERGRLAAIVALQRDSFRQLAGGAGVNHSHLAKFLDGRANLGPEGLQRLLERLGLAPDGTFDTQRVYDWAVGPDLAPLKRILHEMAPRPEQAFRAAPVTSTRYALPTEHQLAHWPVIALKNDSFRIRIVGRIPVDDRHETNAFSEGVLPLLWRRFANSEDGAVMAVRLDPLEFDEWRRGVPIDLHAFDAAFDSEPVVTMRDVEKALADWHLTWAELLSYAKARAALVNIVRPKIEAANANSPKPRPRKRL